MGAGEASRFQVIPGGRDGGAGSPGGGRPARRDAEMIRAYQRQIADLKDTIFAQSVVLDQARELVAEGLQVHRDSADVIRRELAVIEQMLPECRRRVFAAVSRDEIMRLEQRRADFLAKIQELLDLMVETREEAAREVG